MNIAIPENVQIAMKTLEENGFEAYAVGGCVRDSLLGLTPYDWDICTSALPEQTMECFADYRVIPTGVKHGTITVIIESPLEITTFRIDGDYLDNRRPSEVSFTGKLKDDLSRRDFTVNAMALSQSGEIIDLYCGKADLKSKLIRCVGCAEKRFDEDALRIMRALRFASTLGFGIEKETAAAIHKKKHLLNNIAAERIQKEFSKLLTGNCHAILSEFEDVIKTFLPEAQLDNDSIRQIELTPADVTLRLAMLLKSTSVQNADKRLRTLKFDNRTVSSVRTVLGSIEETIVTERPKIKRLINKYSAESIKAIIDFHLGCERITASEHKAILKTAEEITKNGECCTLSKLAVKGSDITALGLFPQNKTGKVLYALLEKVMDGETENEKSALIKLAKSLKY